MHAVQKAHAPGLGSDFEAPGLGPRSNSIRFPLESDQGPKRMHLRNSNLARSQDLRIQTRAQMQVPLMLMILFNLMTANLPAWCKARIH